jgi:hypothetical protein
MSYINSRQFNALRDLAMSSDSTYFNSDWHGPPATNRTNDGVISSLALISVAIGPPSVQIEQLSPK